MLRGRTIPTPTTLSIQQTATLLQKLVDLQKGDDGLEVYVPPHITYCVSTLLKAQTEFAKGIDEYMHLIDYEGRPEDDIETVSTIVETCPQFLATEDSWRDLPIHCFAHNRNVCHLKYIPLLAQNGLLAGIGGEEGRGGLLLNGSKVNTLQLLAQSPSAAVVFDVLGKTNPPLFFKEDVRKQFLTHHAVRYSKDMFAILYFIAQDPMSLFFKTNHGRLPIGCICEYEIEGEYQDKKHLDILKIILAYNIQDNNDSKASIGGLFAEISNSDNTLVLDGLIRRFGEERVWDTIDMSLSSFTNLPILHQTIKYAPRHCLTVMDKFPDSTMVRDAQNRLPIHVALDYGMPWNGGALSFIINANRPHLKDLDPVTKLPPFILAAVNDTKSCDLRTVFYLLRKNPEHATLIFNICKERKHSDGPTSTVATGIKLSHQ